jgi:hypothetical protein
MNSNSIEIGMTLAVTLSGLRQNSDDSSLPALPARLEEMKNKHIKDLEVVKAQFALLNEQCKADNVDPETSEDFQECAKRCNDVLNALNKDCLGELAQSSVKFLKAISAAHSAFVEDLVNLATVYGCEENVEFDKIKLMFNTWLERARENIRPYKTHAEILVDYADNPDVRDHEMERHRRAAFIYKGKFCEDVKDPDYNTLDKVFEMKNEANDKSLRRTKDHLWLFSSMALKSPATWTLVEFRKNGIVPDRFLDLTDQDIYKDSVDVLVTDALKVEISDLAGQTIF